MLAEREGQKKTFTSTQTHTHKGLYDPVQKTLVRLISESGLIYLPEKSHSLIPPLKGESGCVKRGVGFPLFFPPQRGWFCEVSFYVRVNKNILRFSSVIFFTRPFFRHWIGHWLVHLLAPIFLVTWLASVIVLTSLVYLKIGRGGGGVFALRERRKVPWSARLLNTETMCVQKVREIIIRLPIYI